MKSGTGQRNKAWPIQSKRFRIPELVVNPPALKELTLVFDAGPTVFEQFPRCGPKAFGMVGQCTIRPHAAGVHPSHPRCRREVFPRKAQLVGKNMFGGNRIIVERLTKAVPDEHMRIVQNRMAHDRGLQTEVNILDSPVAHVGIDATQLIVQLTGDGECAADQAWRLVKLSSIDLPSVQASQRQPFA